MEDVKFDGKSINAYADSVWSESLTGNTRFIDESLRTKPGKYDEEDVLTGLVADKQKRDYYSGLVDEFKKNFDADNDYDYDYLEDYSYISDDVISDNQDIKNDAVLIERRKKRESYKKFVARMAAAIVICGATSAYIVGYNLINNPQVLDRFRSNKSETTIVEERNIDVKDIAKKRLDALSLKYSNVIMKNKHLIYNGVNGSRFSYDSNGKIYVSYNTEGITKILKAASEKGDLEFRIALLAIADEIGERSLYDVLSPCVEKVGYDLIIKNNEEEESDRKPIGPGYHSISEYLQYETNNIYYDIIVDTENKINDGSIYVFDNGTFYETDANTNNRGRSK